MRQWAAVALAIVIAIVIGTLAYQAGVSQGMSVQRTAIAAPPAAGGNAQPVPGPGPPPDYAYRYYRPWRFGFFGPLFGILFFVFLMRTLFWGLCGFGLGGGWRRRWRYYDYPDAGPSRFDDWHRRAHEQMRDDRAPAPPTA